MVFLGQCLDDILLLIQLCNLECSLAIRIQSLPVSSTAIGHKGRGV